MSEPVHDDQVRDEGRDVARAWHRRFAVECNNRAWDLSVQPRTPLQDREMLDCAHASAWHWDKIGSELNRMRAVTLLAEVHAQLGFGRSALAFAQTMSDFFAQRGETEAWERAITSAVEAHAAHAGGDMARHGAAHARAVLALAGIDDEEDRAIVFKTFAQVPTP